MRSLQELEIFVRTAETGSLSATARLLDLTPAAASAALKRLEAELHVPLFVRSTRSLRLTAQGELYLAHCRQALELLASGRDALQSGGSQLRGTLQLSMPSDLGRNVLLPWLAAFQAQHPQLSLRMQVSDRLADVYREPVDLALRYGELPDSSLVALPLVPDNRRVLCAAPAYLQQYGAPQQPDDLRRHNCLCYMLGDAIHDSWRFFRHGSAQLVAVRGRQQLDDGDVVRRLAVAGYGIAYKSALDVADDLRAGRLQALCTDWQGDPAPLNLMCADRRQLSPAVQALRAFLAERLAAHAL
ncbi:LysR family transcriptional regulator [Vogesella sp. LIG4]|uniref:LysR family transcriptional regulator n=1 Tax=Vogesella sp. LIG4 TaxID=1192162 RepID=UPI00081FC3F8|nr:LysR family transcriptional regulator [Vogesella sp. LIG4]SCK25525.1 DNA-binding transcriptional regulator, LysR family [Vogesella sp. LIG4]